MTLIRSVKDMCRGLPRATWSNVVLTSLSGLALVCLYQANPDLGIPMPLARWSYDLSVRCLANRHTADVALIVVDDVSIAKLGTQSGGCLSRTNYAALLRHLKRAGASVVVFDIVFDAQDVAADTDFVAAIKEHGNVVLAAYVRQEQVKGADLRGPGEPNSALKNSGARIGYADFDADGDYAVRRFYPQVEGSRDKPALACVAYEALRGTPAKRGHLPDSDAVFLNYPGVGDRAFDRMQLFMACDPANLAILERVAKEKIVLVGQQSLVPWLGAANDIFVHPRAWRMLSGADRYWRGLQIHAVALENLLNDRFLQMPSLSHQTVIVFVWGAVVAMFLPGALQKRRTEQFVLIFGILLLSAESLSLPAWRQQWWPWLVPVLWQSSVALTFELIRRARQRPPYLVFVAYRRPGGSDWIPSIVHGLRTRQVGVWYDKDAENPQTTDDYRPQIDRKIEKAPCFILLVTKSMLQRLMKDEPDFEPQKVINHKKSEVRREIEKAIETERSVIVICESELCRIKEADLPTDLPVDRLEKWRSKILRANSILLSDGLPRCLDQVADSCRTGQGIVR